MVPYRQGRAAADDAFKLSSNENPFEPLESVLEAIAESSINRYPEGSAAALRDRLGARFPRPHPQAPAPAVPKFEVRKERADRVRGPGARGRLDELRINDLAARRQQANLTDDLVEPRRRR